MVTTWLVNVEAERDGVQKTSARDLPVGGLRGTPEAIHGRRNSVRLTPPERDPPAETAQGGQPEGDGSLLRDALSPMLSAQRRWLGYMRFGALAWPRLPSPD